jgi:hypothetical protein
MKQLITIESCYARGGWESNLTLMPIVYDWRNNYVTYKFLITNDVHGLKQKDKLTHAEHFQTSKLPMTNVIYLLVKVICKVTHMKPWV